MNNSPPDTMAQYDALCDAFFDVYYTYHPSHATRQGLHQYDSHLGHYHRDQIAETLRRMTALQRQLAQIEPERMDHLHRLVHDLLHTENPFHCPHGRPIIIRITAAEILKWFKRT